MTRALAALGLTLIPLLSYAQLQTEASPPVPGAKPVTIERIKVHGAALESNLEGNSTDRDVLVVLPASYAKEKSRRYAVVYALHGYSIGAEQWSREIHVPQTIEGAFAQGAKEVIVVLPDSKTVHNGSMYSSSPTTGDFERFVARDLVAYIDAHYRTLASRGSRGLVGHSMGGYGATRIGMKHAEVFGSLYIMSPSYFGYIRLVELDPTTGRRLHPTRRPVNVAINSEASILIHREGWYYLLVTHGSCCAGASSTYNIRMGRSRAVTGPFLDNMGIDMLRGGGKLFLGSRGRFIGPGHFGLLDIGDGVQKFSCHYEADLDRGGISVLDIRPLLWRDGWPVAGDNFREGVYEIESARTGTALELAVEGMPVGGPRRRGPGGPGVAPNAPPPPPIKTQTAEQISAKWPAGDVGVRLSPYMLQAQQKWRVTAVADAGGYPGSPYFKITIDGTDRALSATADGELLAAPFTGAAHQLWRIDQLTDATWRVMPKALPNDGAPLALSAVGSSTPTLAKFRADGDRERWLFKTP